MNTTPDTTLDDDELDARLRTTFATIMPLLDDPATSSSGVGHGEGSAHDDDAVVFAPAAIAPGANRRRMAGILGAAAATALVVAGLAVTRRDQTETPATGQPTEELPVPTDPNVTDSAGVDYEIAAPVGSYLPVPCAERDEGPCNPFAELPVVDGASDFYVGPERLGTPVVSLAEFGRLVRCARLDASATTCEKLEGYAGVGLTRYPSDVTVDTTGIETAGALDVEVGTTFTDITPTAYAEEWGNYPEIGDARIEDVTVRGQPAVAYTYAASRYVVWSERPGVLVWVKAADDAPDQLLSIAEGVRRVPGPDTIPWIVSVPDDKHGQSYDAGSNDADTLVVGKQIDGSECVGYGFIGSACGGTIGEQTFVEIVDDRALVTGITPPTVTSARISQNGTPLVDTPTRQIDPSTNLLFSEYVDVEGPVTVEWIDASGVVASTEVEIDFCRTACG